MVPSPYLEGMSFCGEERHLLVSLKE